MIVLMIVINRGCWLGPQAPQLHKVTTRAAWLVLLAQLHGCTLLPIEALPADPAGAANIGQLLVPALDPAVRQPIVAAMAERQWQQAQTLLLALAAASPLPAMDELNLGIVSEHLNLPLAAEQAYRRALAQQPDNIAVLNRLALNLRQQGQFAAAVAYYQQAIAIDPSHADSHRNLGILYDLYLGQWPEALAAYEAYQRCLSSEDPQMNLWVRDLRQRISKQLAGTQ